MLRGRNIGLFTYYSNIIKNSELILTILTYFNSTRVVLVVLCPMKHEVIRTDTKWPKDVFIWHMLLTKKKINFCYDVTRLGVFMKYGFKWKLIRKIFKNLFFDPNGHEITWKGVYMKYVYQIKAYDKKCLFREIL